MQRNFQRRIKEMAAYKRKILQISRYVCGHETRIAYAEVQFNRGQKRNRIMILYYILNCSPTFSKGTKCPKKASAWDLVTVKVSVFLKQGTTHS